MSPPISRGNLHADIPTELPEELSQVLLRGRGGLRVERIVSRGHRSPEGYWYDQDEDEWVVLISGSARLRLADQDPGVVDLVPGDWLRLPARCRHRVEATDPDTDTVWLALFHPADPVSGLDDGA